jgi:SAM-dependent methyltransferase
MLDVGCGNGATLRAFGQMAPGWTKAGTEFDEKYRTEIEAIPNTEPLHVGPVEFVPGAFDVITMVHVLEHIVEPVGVLETLRGKLASGGLFLVQGWGKVGRGRKLWQCREIEVRLKDDGFVIIENHPDRNTDAEKI